MAPAYYLSLDDLRPSGLLDPDRQASRTDHLPAAEELTEAFGRLDARHVGPGKLAATSLLVDLANATTDQLQAVVSYIYELPDPNGFLAAAREQFIEIGYVATSLGRDDAAGLAFAAASHMIKSCVVAPAAVLDLLETAVICALAMAFVADVISPVELRVLAQPWAAGFGGGEDWVWG